MAPHAGPATAAEPLTAFLEAGSEALPGEFGRLVAAFWTDGALNDPAAAREAVPRFLASWDGADAAHRGYLALGLGLFAEAEYPELDGPVALAVRQGLDRFLDEARGHTTVSPLTLALVYLLSHFPDERARVLPAFAHVPLDPDDRTRLDRGLTRLDPDDPDLGRAWPSPHDWDIDAQERDFDRAWTMTLTPEQITGTWDDDTRTLWATAGAKALWSLGHGMPTPVTDENPYWSAGHRAAGPRPGTDFAGHASSLRCPSCRGELAFEERGARCRNCSTYYPVALGGILDLSRRERSGAGVSDAAEDVEADVLQNAAVMSTIGEHYEAGLRPAFLRVMGQNWDGAVTPAIEDAYLHGRLRRAAAHSEGPVLDLAAGAGRWTWVVADAVGADRVIAADLNDAMLHWLRGRLPQVSAVRADALELPLADASVTAVNCWNALQAMPDAAQAIAEIGRCLKPGGVLTLMTFRWADDQVYRYFQRSHIFPARPEGYLLFEPREIRSWLAAAGLSVVEESGPGTFVLLTAKREG
ncbi:MULTISPECIES: class I SAM-dependent methyltransferase [unclassified Streptomyces]|uniref:class I SAM-dependent methyltransferase n=1 Tax=unclassified Streptomyces TaxID=2593676 RepID=UPI000BAC62A2|nr:MULTISPECIES: class I SAM-dependent methyltransferase [unclassified Streptomyces]ASY34735.1 SAM-dependent methyltransferase [Streptomyces sp. CLI2509]MYX21608.1 methyltransferase domain-containing protein [Streptomyces sp. SID8380]